MAYARQNGNDGTKKKQKIKVRKMLHWPNSFKRKKHVQNA